MAKISERDYRLLTSYVDGELSARQRRMVLRLLRRSPTARTLLQHLQQDSHDLRNLTKLKLPADFSARVVQTLELRSVVRPLVRTSARRHALPSWLGLAAAAMLLLAVGALAFTVFTKTLGGRQSGTLAEKSSGNDDSSSDESSSAGGSVAKTSSADDSRSSETSLPPLVIEEELKKLPAEAPLTEDKMSRDFGNATTKKDLEVFAETKKADVIHPTIKELRGLKAAEVLPKLKQERAVRVDFACKKGTLACERLQGVLKAAGINLITEQVAEYRLKHPNLDTNYVVYLEDVTPEDFAKILEALGREDQKGESSKSTEAQFAGLVMGRMTDADAGELKKLFGAYGKLLRLHLTAGSGSSSAFDPKKSLASATPDEILKAPPRPESSKASSKAERVGLILPYNPVKPQMQSQAVYSFIEASRHARPDALQVLLVLHEPR